MSYNANIVDTLNQNNKSNNYEFIIDKRDNDIMRMRFKTIPTFEKNELVSKDVVRHLNDIVKYDDRINRTIAFINSGSVENAISVYIAYITDYNIGKTGSWNLRFDIEKANDIFDEIYKYYAENPIIMIIDRLRYLAVAYQGTDFEEDYEQLVEHKYIKQSLVKAVQGFKDLLLIIEASSI